MKKKILLVFLALVLVPLLLSAACAAPAPAPAPPVFEWPSDLAVGTAATGSPIHLTATAWAPILESMHGTKVRVVAEKATTLVAKWVREGSIDIWLTVMAVPVHAQEAKHGYATRDGGPVPVAAVWTGGSIHTILYVRGDSHIKSWDDIKPGTKYACWVGSPTHLLKYEAYCAWLGFTEEELIKVPFGSLGESYRAVMEGKADLCAIAVTSPVLLESVAAPHGVRIIDMPWRTDPEGLKRHRSVMPEVMGTTIPKGIGPEICWGRDGLMAALAHHVRMDADPELAYHLAKWLDESHEAFPAEVGLIPTMTREAWRMALDQCFLPVHEGAIKYLKEIGMWTAADDTRQEYNTKLYKWYEKAYKVAIDMADKEGIKIDPLNEEWVELWKNYKKEIGIPRYAVLTDEEIQERLPLVSKGLALMK